MSTSLTVATEGLLQEDGTPCVKTVVVQTETPVIVATPVDVRTAVVSGVSNTVATTTVSPVLQTEQVTNNVFAQVPVHIVYASPSCPAAGEGTPGTPGTADKHYRWVQNSPASVWTITHNMDKYPAVTIVDSGGSEVVGDLIYISMNAVQLLFSAPFAGEAFFN